MHGDTRGRAAEAVRPAPPFAVVTGDFHQPGLEVTFKVAPVAKLSIQLINKRQGRVVVKGRRGAMEANIEELLVYLRPVTELRAAAPPVQQVGTPVPAVRLSARERLAGAEGLPGFQ